MYTIKIVMYIHMHTYKCAHTHTRATALPLGTSFACFVNYSIRFFTYMLRITKVKLVFWVGTYVFWYVLVMAGGNFNQQSRVELSVSCTKLLDLDTFSKSDPFAVLYKATSEGQKKSWLKLGRTEVIYDNLDPKVRECMSQPNMERYSSFNSFKWSLQY